MASEVMVFGSLTSTLARNQSRVLVELLQKKCPKLDCCIDLVTSPVSEDDKQDELFMSASAKEIAFLSGLVIQGKIRVFVAEASDLLRTMPVGLDILCVPQRSTPYDALLNQNDQIMDEMPKGSRIGVLSRRARTQMEVLWPDLVFQTIQGGVDKAMSVHMDGDKIDGLVLPASATEQLGIQSIVSEIYAPDFLLPGTCQGMLVIVGKADDDQAKKLLAALNSKPTDLELRAEMAFFRRIITDQDLPIGALARVKGKKLFIEGTTGAANTRVEHCGGLANPEEIGRELGAQLLSSPDSFLALLEADFPEGLPPESDDNSLDEDEDEND